ncbi:MAG: methylmalonyl Co-A mutase-associated GTPase MeaB [Bacteroidetes bacterium]|nr:MAG: methylmalonyl Co-A mutase-associated GTPase MeaB [Bacteroidota bacterium]
MKKFSEYTAQDYFSEIRNGNRVVLSKAITLVESTNPKHHKLAQEIIRLCLPYTGNSLRLGISGVPGAGKSTFIESFGLHIVNQGKKLGVLAIDPSSTKTKGSILGDKTRMEKLSVHPYAYIRPSASGGNLGGVSRTTRETMLLLEAAGFEVVIIETVGVGQSETEVHSMVDCFILLLLTGAGDELQGVKRGIMEMSDIFLINKADGNNLEEAKKKKAELKKAIHFLPPHASGWQPVVEICSALTGFNIDKVWEIVLNYIHHSKSSGYFESNRNRQLLNWMHNAIKTALYQKFYTHPEVKKHLEVYAEKVINRTISPYAAAEDLMRFFRL